MFFKAPLKKEKKFFVLRAPYTDLVHSQQGDALQGRRKKAARPKKNSARLVFLLVTQSASDHVFFSGARVWLNSSNLACELGTRVLSVLFCTYTSHTHTLNRARDNDFQNVRATQTHRVGKSYQHLALF
jgi:hypothetical protein